MALKTIYTGIKAGGKKLLDKADDAFEKVGTATTRGAKRQNKNPSNVYKRNEKGRVASIPRKKRVRQGQAVTGGGVATAVGTGIGGYSLFKDDKKKDEKSAKADKKATKPTGRFGEGSSKTRNGKANVSKEQLEKTGLTLTAYMNKWNKSGKRPTAAAASSKSSTKKSSSKNRPAIFGKDAKFRPLGGVLARALLGDDEKFGGERGLIDFVRTKKKKPVKKNLGGMMKAKGSRAQSRATLSPAQRRLLNSVQGREGTRQATSVIQDLSDKYGYAPGKRAGAKGGMGKGKRAKPPGMRAGGMSMKSKMASKGGKMGGKVPPGYKNGGSVGRKKARGVGAAKRGFGRAMR